MLHSICAPSRIFLVQNRVRHPVRNLVKESSTLSNPRDTRHTLLLACIQTVMLSVASVFCSRARCRHSMGLIRWNRVLSIIVSCLAISSGSISSNLSFLFDFGTIGGGACERLTGTIRVRSPPFYRTVSNKPTTVVLHEPRGRCEEATALRPRSEKLRQTERIVLFVLVSAYLLCQGYPHR